MKINKKSIKENIFNRRNLIYLSAPALLIGSFLTSSCAQSNNEPSEEMKKQPQFNLEQPKPIIDDKNSSILIQLKGVNFPTNSELYKVYEINEHGEEIQLNNNYIIDISIKNNENMDIKISGSNLWNLSSKILIIKIEEDKQISTISINLPRIGTEINNVQAILNPEDNKNILVIIEGRNLPLDNINDYTFSLKDNTIDLSVFKFSFYDKSTINRVIIEIKGSDLTSLYEKSFTIGVDDKIFDNDLKFPSKYEIILPEIKPEVNRISTMLDTKDNKSIIVTINGKNLPQTPSSYKFKLQNSETFIVENISIEENSTNEEVIIKISGNDLNYLYDQIFTIEIDNNIFTSDSDQDQLKFPENLEPIFSTDIKSSLSNDKSKILISFYGNNLPDKIDSYRILIIENDQNSYELNTEYSLSLTKVNEKYLLTIEGENLNNLSQKICKIEIRNKNNIYITIKLPLVDLSSTNPSHSYTYNPHLYRQLPVINIETDNGNTFATERKDTYVQNKNGYWEFSKPEFEYQNAKISMKNFENNSVKVDIPAQVKVRGNSTTLYDKKPFRIKFNEKQEMFSLNNNYSSKDWVLIANWRDVSMLRNNIGFYLGQVFYKNFGLYSSDFVNVELYLNGEYWGVYLLCEQNEVASGRVNIDKPVTNYQGTDIGYLLEMDNYAEFEDPLNQFTINYNNKAKLSKWNHPNTNIFSSNSPSYDYAIKSKIYSKNQQDFISQYLENIYKICYKSIINEQAWVFNEDKTNIIQNDSITPEQALENILDLDSAASMIILNEVVCDYDIKNSSFYMSIDMSEFGDKKLKFQAPWDFDVSLGTISYGESGIDTETELYAANSNNPWCVLLYKSEAIRNKIKEKWIKAKESSLQEKLLQYIDDFSNMYIEQFKKNYDKWHNIAPYIEEEYNKIKDIQNPNITHTWSDLRFSREDSTWGCTTQKQAADFLKIFLEQRYKVLNSEWIDK